MRRFALGCRGGQGTSREWPSRGSRSTRGRHQGPNLLVALPFVLLLGSCTRSVSTAPTPGLPHGFAFVEEIRATICAPSLGPFVSSDGRTAIAAVQITFTIDTRKLALDLADTDERTMKRLASQIADDADVKRVAAVLSLLRCIEWLEGAPAREHWRFAGVPEEGRSGRWWAPSLLHSFDPASLSLYGPDGACWLKWADGGTDARVQLLRRADLEGYVARLRQKPTIAPLVVALDRGEATCQLRKD